MHSPLHSSFHVHSPIALCIDNERRSISKSIEASAFYSLKMPGPPKQRKIALVGSRSVGMSSLGRPSCCLANSELGKSSLTVQYVDGHFVESYYPTIENTFSKVIRYRGTDFATEIIDTAGQVSTTQAGSTGKDNSLTLPKDEYSILNSKHYIGIHGYMLVYSVASTQSFEMVRIIRDKILNHLVRPGITHNCGHISWLMICTTGRGMGPTSHRWQQERHAARTTTSLKGTRQSSSRRVQVLLDRDLCPFR